MADRMLVYNTKEKKVYLNKTSMEDYPYNVTVEYSVNGKDFYYCGNGRFCKTLIEVEEYINKVK